MVTASYLREQKRDMNIPVHSFALFMQEETAIRDACIISGLVVTGDKDMVQQRLP